MPSQHRGSLGERRQARGCNHKVEGCSRHISENTDTDLAQAQCRGGIGLMLSEIGQQEEALRTLRAALATMEGLPDTEFEQAVCHKNIGLALARMDVRRRPLQAGKKL